MTLNPNKDTVMPINISSLANPKTSDEARASIAEIESERTAVHTALDAYAETRDDLLVGGDESAIEQAETEAQDLQRYLDRLDAGHRRLTKQADELAAAERHKQAVNQIKKAQAAMHRGIKIIDEYGEHAQAIGALVEETEGIHAQIRAALDVAEELGIEPGELTFPHAHSSLNSRDEPKTERVYTGRATDGWEKRSPHYQGGDPHNANPTENSPANWEERHSTIQGKSGLNLAAPGYNRGISLPAPNNNFYVNQR